MRGVYIAHTEISGVNSARTLMYLTAHSLSVIEILSISVTNADVETNEMISAGLFRISALGTPTATTLTAIEKSEEGTSDTTATIKTNVTASEPTYNTNPLDKQGTPNLAGYFYDPTPEERPTVSPGKSIGIRLLSAPAAFNCVVILKYREIGG